MIDDTYDDDDDVNREPINNVIDDTDDDNKNDRKPIHNGFLQPVGERKGATGMMNEREGVLYDQYSMPVELDHLDSISSMPDPYSIKQWNQLNHHAYSKQDLYGPLKHVYNRKTIYGEQRLTLYIINYCSDSINSYSYDNSRVCSYCYEEHHILFDTDISNKQKRQGQLNRDPRVLEYTKQIVYVRCQTCTHIKKNTHTAKVSVEI